MTSKKDKVSPLLYSCLVAIFSWDLLLLTAEIPITWDEGDYITRADGIIDWFHQLDDIDLAAFNRAHLANHFPFATQQEGHPALFALVIACGHILSYEWCSALTSYRIGTMTLFSIAVAIVFHRIRAIRGNVAAIVVATTLLTMPRLFGHQHLATGDGQLTSWWLIASATFPVRKAGWVHRLSWACVLGLCMSTKFTGWLMLVPAALWTCWYDRSVRGALWFAATVAIALGVFVIVNPTLWHEPIDGIVHFLQLNLGRASRIHVKTFFLGQIYDSEHTLPWYNTLLWTAISVPSGLLLLACVGLVSIFRRDGKWTLPDSWSSWILMTWLTPMIVRSLPGAPPHDGVRLFLPAFGMLAIFTAIGADVVTRRLSSHRLRRLGIAAVTISFLSAALNLCWYAPQYLSYYNLLAGGLRGAVRMGMEPTYWWDAMDEEVYSWIEQHTHEDDVIGCSFIPNVDRLQAWGLLQRKVRFMRSLEAGVNWYLVHNRPSSLQNLDREIKATMNPVYKKTIRRPSAGFGPWQLDVPLIEIYDLRQNSE